MAYKLMYYRFGEVMTDYNHPKGYDRVRNAEIGNKNIVLEHFDEAFTSEHWIVRIFKVRKQANRPVGYHLSNRKQHPQPSSKKSPKKPVKKAVKKAYEFVGCVSSEAWLGKAKEYGGGSAGANVRIAAHQAKTANRPYFAVARSGSDGHSFTMHSKPARLDKEPSLGCRRPCLDDDEVACGCSDAFCTEKGDHAVQGEENVRRWAVYKVV